MHYEYVDRHGGTVLWAQFESKAKGLIVCVCVYVSLSRFLCEYLCLCPCVCACVRVFFNLTEFLSVSILCLRGLSCRCICTDMCLNVQTYSFISLRLCLSIFLHVKCITSCTMC